MENMGHERQELCVVVFFSAVVMSYVMINKKRLCITSQRDVNVMLL